MPKKQKAKPTKAHVQQWLKSKGIKAKKVDAKAMNTDAQMLADVLDLVGVRVEEYERAKAKG
jgi:arsenate reductase-like glutaredoxin family protein